MALEAFGTQSSEELAGRLGISRVRNLERRRLEPLERMGLVERHEGLWGRPKDFRDRDQKALAEPYTHGVQEASETSHGRGAQGLRGHRDRER